MHEYAAGGVVYRETAAGIEIVLGEQADRLSGTRNTRLPKGKIDPGESAEAAAVREVREETGITAEIEAGICETRHSFVERGKTVEKSVRYFLMRATAADAQPDGEFARVYWCALAAAPERLTYENEADAVRRAAVALAAR